MLRVRKYKMKLRYLFLLFPLIYSSATWGIIKFEDAVFPELVTNSRPLAMGNAFICKVDDSSSVFYNPSGLGTVRWGHLHLTNVHIETNRGLLRTTTGGNVTSITQNAVKGFNLDGTRQLLKDNPGTFTHNRFNIMPNLTTRYFSLGFLYSQQTRAHIGLADDSKFEFATRQDLGPYAALNLSLFGGVIKLGGSAAYLTREELIEDRDKEETIELQNSDYNRGKAIIVTGGIKIVLPIAFLPTLAGTMHNVMGRPFTSEMAGSPDAIKETLDVGLSITPQLGNFLRVHMEVNLKDIGSEYTDVTAARKLLMGIEFDFSRAMFVRFGYGDGFGSVGLGIRSRRLEFDLTSYAVDTSSSGIRGDEDRRFALTISSGI